MFVNARREAVTVTFSRNHVPLEKQSPSRFTHLASAREAVPVTMWFTAKEHVHNDDIDVRARNAVNVEFFKKIFFHPNLKKKHMEKIKLIFFTSQ